MQLLARSLKTFRHVFANSGWFTLLVAGAVLSLEVVGRQTTSDWHDVLAAALLAVLMVGVAARHSRSPLPWLVPVSALGRLIGHWLKGWLVEVGYDLRGEPRVKRGLPPIIFGVAGLFFGWGVVLLAAGDFFPHALRVFGVKYFYVGYLLIMMVIWGGLILGTGLSFWFAVGLVHDELSADSDGSSMRGPSRAALGLGLGATLMLGSRFVPLWQVLTLCLLAWGALTILALSGGASEISFLWRPRQSTRVRSVTAPQSAALMFGLAIMLALNFIVTAAGTQVWKDPLGGKTAMPLTITLGSVLGWVLLALLWVFVWQAARERLRSPARHSRRIIHVRGPLTAPVRRSLVRHFPRRDWRIDHDPQPVDPCAVTLEFVEPTRSEAREFDPGWPLKLCLDDLDDARVRDRIARRCDIQVRRRIMGGLERLFKIAGRRKYRNGHGYWVAPHLQLWNGLRRDEPEPEPGPFDTHMVHDNIGPAYHRVFPQLARHSAFRMMRSLQLDLIFVEDGVPYKRFAKVVRRLFDLYDKQPGRAADDMHFVGLTGTKAIVYDFQFDNAYESDTYPEPKFTTLGRARILLVFRDRSAEDELVEPPFDFSRSPAPLAR